MDRSDCLELFHIVYIVGEPKIKQIEDQMPNEEAIEERSKSEKK